VLGYIHLIQIGNAVDCWDTWRMKHILMYNNTVSYGKFLAKMIFKLTSVHTSMWCHCKVIISFLLLRYSWLVKRRVKLIVVTKYFYILIRIIVVVYKPWTWDRKFIAPSYVCQPAIGHFDQDLWAPPVARKVFHFTLHLSNKVQSKCSQTTKCSAVQQNPATKSIVLHLICSCLSL